MTSHNSDFSPHNSIFHYSVFISQLSLCWHSIYFCLYPAMLFISVYTSQFNLFVFCNCVYTSQFCLYLAILFICHNSISVFMRCNSVYIWIMFIHHNSIFCVYPSQLSFISNNSVYTLQFYFCVYILVEYPVSCLNISDGKSCSVLTLLGQQLLHVWKRKGVNRKHFIQSDTTNQLQRFWHFAQDILTNEKLRSSSDSEQRGSEFCFCTSATTPAKQLPVSGFLWNHTT